MKKLLWIVASCALYLVSASSVSRASTESKPKEAAERATPSHAKDAKGTKGAPSATAGTPASTTAESGIGVVNLNEATAEQLQLLPKVGPSRANAIVAHRKAHPFKRIEELTRVKGIGKKTFARLRPLLSLSGPTTLKAQELSSAVASRR